MAVGETPGQGCQSGSKSLLEFGHAKTIKGLRFVWMTVSDCRKQVGPLDAGNSLRKSHFIMCHVTEYSTIRGVFQQPWPGVSPTAILNEEKALGTRLSWQFVKKNLLDTVFGFCYVVLGNRGGVNMTLVICPSSPVPLPWQLFVTGNRSNEGSTLETAAFKFLYSGQLPYHLSSSKFLCYFFPFSRLVFLKVSISFPPFPFPFFPSFSAALLAPPHLTMACQTFEITYLGDKAEVAFKKTL